MVKILRHPVPEPLIRVDKGGHKHIYHENHFFCIYAYFNRNEEFCQNQKKDSFSLFVYNNNNNYGKKGEKP